MTDQSIKDKIRGLLNIAADDAASEAEIENALRIAQRMMEKHHLSEEDLAEDPLRQAADAVNAPKTKEMVDLGAKIYTWETMLARVVADCIVQGVGYYTSKSSTTKSGLIRRDFRGSEIRIGVVVFYGTAEDVSIAERIYTEVRKAIISLARLRYGSVFQGDGAAYAEGFVTGLEMKANEHLRQEKDEAQKRLTHQSDNRGMILISRRNDLIRQKTESAQRWLASPAGGGVRLRTQTRSGSGGSGDARAMGRKDGAGYNVNGSRARKLC